MPFGSEIKRLREDAKISVDKITARIGVNSSRWRKWEEKDLTPRNEDATKIEKFFGMDIEKIMKLTSIKKFLIVPHEKDDDDNPNMNLSVGDGETEYKTTQKTGNKKADKIIEDLAASSRDHAAADLKRAETELLREINHKRIIDHITDNVPGENSPVLETILPGLRELIVELGMGKHWKSKEEGSAAVSSKLFGKIQKNKVKGIRTG